MKNMICLTLAAAAVTLGAAGAANAAVGAKPGEAVRSTVAPLELVTKADWREHRRHRRVCTWRHHRRVCWWRSW